MEEVVDWDTYHKVNYQAAEELGYYYNGKVASEKLREAIAKDFNRYFQKRYFNKNGRVRSSLGRFLRKFYDTIINFIHSSANIDYRSQLFYDVYYGRYAQAITDQVMAEQLTGVRPSNKTFDSLGVEIIANAKGRADKEVVMKVFDGDLSVISSIQHYAGMMFYSRGYISPFVSPGNADVTLRSALIGAKEDLVNDAANILSEYSPDHFQIVEMDGEVKYHYVYNGQRTPLLSFDELLTRTDELAGMMGNISVGGIFARGRTSIAHQVNLSSITPNDVKGLHNKRNEGKSLYFVYKFMLHYNDGLFEGLLQREMDRVPVNAIMSEEMSEEDLLGQGVFVQDSIDPRGNDEINISTRMSDVLRGIIRHTPLHTFRIEDGRLAPSASRDYFNYHIGVQVLEDLYMQASFPMEEEARQSGLLPVRQMTRFERMRRLAENALYEYMNNFDVSKAKVNADGELDDADSKYYKHLYSLYQF
jgi:hypothetical protein